MIRVEFNGMDFEDLSKEWMFTLNHNTVYFDGINVYESETTKVWENEGFSGDGMRRTGGVYHYDDHQGDVITRVPEKIMDYLREVWASRQSVSSVQVGPPRNTLTERITIGGVTHQRWQWCEGCVIPNAPTADDMEVIQAEGLVCEKQSYGWDIYDPRAVDFLE